MSSAPSSSRPVTSKSRGICKYYTTDRGCFAGKTCKFLHGQVATHTPYDQAKTCRFYAAGRYSSICTQLILILAVPQASANAALNVGSHMRKEKRRKSSMTRTISAPSASRNPSHMVFSVRLVSNHSDNLLTLSASRLQPHILHHCTRHTVCPLLFVYLVFSA
jgi:hypothetical protein